MRIAVGGFMHESNTFSRSAADRDRFREGSLTYGAALVPVWREAHHEVGGFLEGADKYGFDVVPLAMAWATPSGPVSDALFEHVCDALVTGVRMAQPDGVLVALHGAMVTPTYPDADAEILRRLRAAVGPNVPIAASLDFHGNVSPQMAETADIMVGYQTYPHVDQRARGLLAAQLLARAVKGEIKPVVHVAKPRMIMNLLGQDTAREPMATLMRLARHFEERCGVLSASVMAGFPYADVPEMGPSAIIVTDGDRAKAKARAIELADAMWDVREQLNVPCPTPPEAVTRAMASKQHPVLLVDLGDNIGGGSAGDGTVLLAELMKQRAKGYLVALYAPEAVRVAKAIGVGGVMDGPLGGTDGMHGPPVTVRGVVRSLHEGKWVETEARHGGRRQNDQGHAAVLDLGDGSLVVLTSLRTPPFSLGQLTSLGIDPRGASAIVVKAAVAYKAAYAPIAGEVIEVDTPGLTAINPARFSYSRIRRPMYPLEG